MRRDVLIIKDPEVAKLFADETRRRILHILQHHERSTTELAKSLGKSHSSILHHLHLLQEAGLVEQTRTQYVRNLVQTFYRSTAKRYIISYSLSESISGEEREIDHPLSSAGQGVLEGLEAFGIEVPQGQRERALELIDKFLLNDQRVFEETIEEQRELLNVRWHSYRRIVQLLKQIKLSEDPEQREVLEDLRSIFVSNARV